MYLLNQLKQAFDVQVIDPYGVCPDYLDALGQHSVPATVMDGKVKGHFIGGAGIIQRAVCFLKQLPDWMAMCAGLKKNMRVFEPDVILTNSYKAMALLWMSGVMTTCPVAYYARGWYQKQQIPLLGRWLIKKATSVLAVSNATAKALSLWPIRADQLHVCPTVIDYESVKGDAELMADTMYPTEAHVVKILLPAQLLAAKGQQVAIEAVSVLKQRGIQCVMWLAGDLKMGVNAQFVDDLKAAVEKNGLENSVVFLGHRSDIHALMRQADIVVLPSHTEGFPRTIWEAMILECPVITTPAGGATDLVEHEKTGLLIPFDNAFALAEAIERLVNDKAMTCSLTQKAFKHVTQTYSYDKTFSQIRETLMDICER